MADRRYTDAHPQEDCWGCPFFVAVTSHCNFKSRKYWCIRDKEQAEAERREAEESLPTLF